LIAIFFLFRMIFKIGFFAISSSFIFLPYWI
jgi:hypothetical protein